MMFTLKDSKPGEPLLLHDEPIYLDDKIIGRTTSGNYSFCFEKNLSFGYVNSGNSYETLKDKNIFIEEKRIKNGKKFIEDNLPTLKKAEEEFGVPKEIITAILGVETRYGNIQGKDRVLDSLTTLGFDYPRRAEFFRNELIKFFILTKENNLDIYSVKGSYAGAMGYGQLFHPHTWHMLLIMMEMVMQTFLVQKKMLSEVLQII